MQRRSGRRSRRNCSSRSREGLKNPKVAAVVVAGGWVLLGVDGLIAITTIAEAPTIAQVDGHNPPVRFHNYGASAEVRVTENHTVGKRVR